MSNPPALLLRGQIPTSYLAREPSAIPTPATINTNTTVYPVPNKSKHWPKLLMSECGRCAFLLFFVSSRWDRSPKYFFQKRLRRHCKRPGAYFFACKITAPQGAFARLIAVLFLRRPHYQLRYKQYTPQYPPLVYTYSGRLTAIPWENIIIIQTAILLLQSSSTGPLRNIPGNWPRLGFATGERVLTSDRSSIPTSCRSARQKRYVPDLYNPAHVAGGSRRICMIQHVFLGLDLCYSVNILHNIA